MVAVVSELMKIVQAHLDKYGVKEAEFARRIGTSPQTVSNWKTRGNTLPSRRLLDGVAAVTGQPYLRVLDAALIDAGYQSVDDAQRRQRWTRVVYERPPGEDPGVDGGENGQQGEELGW